MLLTQLQLPFRVVSPDVEELESSDDPHALAIENGRRKAHAVLDSAHDEEVIIACDTIVVLDGTVYGKPTTALAAREMLQLLSGRTHTVMGGLVIAEPAVRCAEDRRWHTLVAETQVTFRTITSSLLDTYITGEEWRGRAGGYAIQGSGAAFIEQIDGCYNNVVGLPVAAMLNVFDAAPLLDEAARETSQ